MAATEYNLDKLAEIHDYIANFENYGKIIPTRAGLAVRLGISKRTLRNWESQSLEVLHALERMDAITEDLLIQKGLNGDTVAGLTKLLLDLYKDDEPGTRRPPTGENIESFKKETNDREACRSYLEAIESRT